jgi:DNA polymerase-3 subunit alpha
MAPDVHTTGTVKVAAVVVGVRVITTKKSGAEMAFVKLEDGTGTIEIVVFPKIFKDTRDYWKDGQPLLVVGKVDVRDETPGIIVDGIETASPTESGKKEEVFVNIPPSTDLNSLKKLKTLLTKNLGDQDAYLVFEEDRKVKLPFKIYWSDSLEREISSILENKVS